MIPGEPTAAQRVREYLDARSADVGRTDLIATQRRTELRVGDLRTLIMQAEALQHMAPHAAQAIEIGPS